MEKDNHSKGSVRMDKEIKIKGDNENLLKLLNQEIYDFCKDCPAWSGTDCTRNPYEEGCLKDQLD